MYIDSKFSYCALQSSLINLFTVIIDQIIYKIIKNFRHKIGQLQMIILPCACCGFFQQSTGGRRGWWVQWLRSLSLTILSLCLLNVSNYFHCLITSMTRKPRPIFISPTETWRIEECSVGTERIYKICFLEIKGSGGMKEFHGVKLRCGAGVVLVTPHNV